MERKRKNETPVSFRIEEAEAVELTAISNRLDLSKSHLVREALRQFLKTAREQTA